MQQSDQSSEKGLSASLRSSLMMLMFGLSILAYLVAIDRPEWFHIQPGAGTAAAMSDAASNRTRAGSEQARATGKAAEL